MNQKIKLVTVVGTRPEIIRLAETIKALDETTEQKIVHTGQNYDYELNQIFFEELGIRKPDYFLEAAGKTSAETVGNVIAKVDDVLEKEKPDAFLVLGDTNSCLGAYAAKRRHIPVFHMEAGNRSFDERVPEELNRRIIDHISDINLVYSDRARDNLLQEGLPSDRIIKTGSPLYELWEKQKEKIEASPVLDELQLKPLEYFLLSIHREENVESDNLLSIVEALKAIVGEYKKPIIASVHPRTQKRLEESGISLPSEIKLMKPFGFHAYGKLQMNALCILSDSGTVSEESSILNVPAVNVREAHERPEAMDEASVIMSGVSSERIVQAVELALKQSRGKTREFRIPADYEVSNVSKKVSRIVLSYIDYVNRVVYGGR